MDRAVEETVARYRTLTAPVRTLQSRINWILLGCIVLFFVGATILVIVFRNRDTVRWFAAAVFVIGAYACIFRNAQKESLAILSAIKESIDEGDDEMAELIACSLQRGIWQSHMNAAPWFQEFFAKRPSFYDLYLQYFFVIQKIRYEF